MISPACPLCGDTHSEEFFVSKEGLSYFACAACDLRFLNPAQRLAASAEQALYATHQNEVGDPAYRKFLSPLFDAIVSRVPQASAGLDFGAGPGPALAAMLEESGYVIEKYDPYFWPDRAPLLRQYDFILSSEVFEHLYEPGREILDLTRLLRPGGLLAVMTLLYPEDCDFDRWHYRRDPTHVVFYSKKTFAWIAAKSGFEAPDFVNERVICLRLVRHCA